MRVDLTGKRFGRLVVLGLDSVRGNGETYWNCICDCGNKKVASRGNLKSGNTQSCGCLHKEVTSSVHHKVAQYDLSGTYGIGYTVNDHTPFYFDLEDYEKIAPYAWFRSDQGYILAVTEYGHQVRMHRLITGYTSDVDHKNRNRADNRKKNLRPTTKQLNGINRGCNKNNKLGIKGVSEINSKYYARIMKDGKTISLGVYDTPEEASIARKRAEKKLFGEFAFEEGGDSIEK